jgi:hypothetical protein
MPENTLKLSPNTNNRDWLAAVFYPLSVILMEAFWVSPWLNWIGTWPLWHETRPVLGLLSVVILLAASLLLTRFAARLKLRIAVIQVIIIGAGVLAMLLVLAAEYRGADAYLSPAWFSHFFTALGNAFKEPSAFIAAVPVIIYLWWRGIMLGNSTSYFKDIYRSFIIGMVFLVFLLIIWQTSAKAGDLSSPTSGLGLNVIAFFFFGLLSIAICHLYMMRSTMPKEDAALTSVWRWMPIMLGVIGVMVLIGFGIASIFSPGMFDIIGKGFSAIGGVLGKALEIILTPVVYIINAFVWVFQWLIKLLRGNNEPLSQNGTGGGVPDFGDVVSKETPLWLTTTLKWLVIAVIVSLVIFILAKAISRSRARRAQEAMDEVNESLFSWKGLKDDLKELLGMMGNRFKRKPHEAGGPVFDPDATGRMDIREIFRHLQWEGRNSGITRGRHETAAEYTRRLERAVPDSVESIENVKLSVESIRDMYEEVRYGEAALPEPKVDKANSLWQNIKAMIRKLREG